MAYPTSVDTGQIAPQIIGTEELAGSAAAGVMTSGANVVVLYEFELTAQVTISGMRLHMGSTATGTTDMGIYNSDGSVKLASTGAVVNSASVTMSNNFSGGNLTLGPGVYLLAFCPSNNTDTYQRVGINPVTLMTRVRQATNAGSAGVLPSTTGALIAVANVAPVFSAIIVGGLP